MISQRNIYSSQTLYLISKDVVQLQVTADEQRRGEIPPVGDWCKSAFGDQSKSTQLKSVIHGRCYLRETFEFPGVTPLLDFIHSTYAVLLVMFVL